MESVSAAGTPPESQPEHLGLAGSTNIGVLVTRRPWAVGLDVLGVSVGPAALGRLGRALVSKHAEVRLPGSLLATVSRSSPAVVHLPYWQPTEPGERGLRALLLLTVHAELEPPTSREAVAATQEVVRAAVQAATGIQTRRLGLPLIGAGAVGAPSTQVAQEVVLGLISALPSTSIDEVVIVAGDPREAEAIRSAWRLATEDSLQTSAPRTPGTSAGSADPGSADPGTAGPPARVELSGSAWRLLRRAVGDPAGTEVDNDRVFVAALLEATTVTGLLDDRVGPVAKSPGLSGMVSVSAFSGSDSELFAIPGIATVTARARAIAWRTSGSPVVHARHLLAAAVLGGLSSFGLAQLGLTQEGLRQHLVDVMREGNQVEWGPAWAAALQAGDATGPLAGGVDADLVRPDLGLRTSDDHMGVSTYVGMMATVVARADTPLPLSIGLFGEWGSGKSTFMGLLRGRITELSESGSPHYLRDIVQIGFNAWTYADANLWASLGDEIFRALIGPEATDDEVRQQVRNELDAKLGRADELVVARDKAVADAEVLQNELDRARTAYVGSLSALGKAASSAALSRVWAALRITDIGEQGRILADEVRTGAHQARLLRRTLLHPQTVSALLLLLASILVLGTAMVIPAVERWMTTLGTVGVLGGITWVGQIARRVRVAFKTLDETATRLRERLDDQADEQLAPRLRDLGQAEARVKVAQAQLDEVLTHAAELRRQLVDLQPGQRLYAFLNERAASGDYSRQLGLVSTIRRDFDRLRTVLADWRATHTENERGIDRIVLYIDDLDRCSPRQVVEVLQAVHLLLALDLFVVVVGVDPRWLLHSLRQEYRHALEADTTQEDVWLSTPSDYVEKIFNVPFVLPAMTVTSFESLVRRLGSPLQAQPTAGSGSAAGLVPDSGAGPARSDPAERGPTTETDVVTPERDLASEETLDRAPVDGAAPPADTTRPMTEAELTMIAALAPLVSTPRQTKRMLNVYRMLRSTQDLGDASTWLGDATTPGQYQAVAVLLGLLTHKPALLGDLLHGTNGLCTTSGQGRTWHQLLAGRVAEDPERWADPADRLAMATALVTLPDVTAFAAWGPHVARFSFLLSTAGSPPKGVDPSSGRGRDI